MASSDKNKPRARQVDCNSLHF